MKEKNFLTIKTNKKDGKMKCPICGSELLEVGYPDELGYQRYCCPNDCEFWKTKQWILRARAYELLGVLVFALFFVLALPLALILRIFGRDKK